MNEETLETVMEAVCEMCHWPFVCGEVALDEKCAKLSGRAEDSGVGDRWLS